MLLATLALGGCRSGANAGQGEAQGSSESDSVFLNQNETSAEYEAAAAQLELPPGVVFPGMPEGVEGGVWQQGAGVAQAQLYWMSAWEVEWLEQRGVDMEREAKALDVLKNQVPESDLWNQHFDQNSRDWLMSCLEKAEAGDPSGFEQDVRANPLVIVHEGD